MDKKDLHKSRSDSIQEKPSSRRNHIIERNLRKQHKRTRCVERIGKR